MERASRYSPILEIHKQELLLKLEPLIQDVQRLGFSETFTPHCASASKEDPLLNKVSEIFKRVREEIVLPLERALEEKATSKYGCQKSIFDADWVVVDKEAHPELNVICLKIEDLIAQQNIFSIRKFIQDLPIHAEEDDAFSSNDDDFSPIENRSDLDSPPLTYPFATGNAQVQLDISSRSQSPAENLENPFQNDLQASQPGPSSSSLFSSLETKEKPNLSIRVSVAIETREPVRIVREIDPVPSPKELTSSKTELQELSPADSTLDSLWKNKWTIIVSVIAFIYGVRKLYQWYQAKRES